MFVNKKIIIVGAGNSLSKYKREIKKFIVDHNLISIGINNVTGILIPDYHLWTNKKRYAQFGNNVSENSEFIFGHKMPKKLIRRFTKKKYIKLNYEEGPDVKFRITTDCLYGLFRNAGSLAIAFAAQQHAEKIYIVGMDGYTFYDKKSLNKNNKTQHCYGKGLTHDNDWKESKRQDYLTQRILNEMSENGVSFKIITPTKFDNHYENLIGVI